MPQRHTIVFPPRGEIEHRYSVDLPTVGSTIQARGTNWLVTEITTGRRVLVRELQDETASARENLAGPSPSVDPAIA